MAELGAVAAIAQLSVYTYKGVTATSALLHRIRHHSEQIEVWIHQLSIITQIIDTLKQRLASSSPVLAELIDDCCKDASKLGSLMRPFAPGSTARTTAYKASFVVRERNAVEGHISSFWTTFGRLTAVRSAMSINSHTPPSQPAGAQLGILTISLRKKRIVQDTLCVLSQLHCANVPISLLTTVIDEESLNQALIYLESESLVRISDSVQTLALHRLEWQRLRVGLGGTARQRKYLSMALQGLDASFPDEFARLCFLTRSSKLEKHVASALQAAMECSLTVQVFEETANLALRYCMYLMTVSKYGAAAEFLRRFLDWCQVLLPQQFEKATVLLSKQAVVEALRGSLRGSYKLTRAILYERRQFYGPAAIDTSHSLNNCALVCHSLGQNKLAMKYHKDALATKETSPEFGKDHPDTLLSVNNLGAVHQAQGDHAFAESLFRRTLNGWSKIFDPDDLFVLAAKSNMGIAACSQDRLDEAEELHQSVLANRRRILGAAHHETLKSRANLAQTLNKKGRRAHAEAEFRDILKRFQRDPNIGPSHPDTLKTYTNLVCVLADQARYREAESVAVEALPLVHAQFGPTHAETFNAMEIRVILLENQQNLANAVTAAGELYGARLQKLKFKHPDTKRSYFHLKDLQRDLEESQMSMRFSKLGATVMV